MMLHATINYRVVLHGVQKLKLILQVSVVGPNGRKIAREFSEDPAGCLG
jgi:hypothetical protein